MKRTMQLVIASLAMIACLAWNPSPALAQAEKFDVIATITNRTYLEAPVFEQVGPLTRLTVHVAYTQLCPDPRLAGTMEVIGVWMIDMRDNPWTFVGHGQWKSVLSMGGEVEGTWCVDSSGTMRGVGFVTGGELDGAQMKSVSMAGSPFLGWLDYEVRILLPASR